MDATVHYAHAPIQPEPGKPDQAETRNTIIRIFGVDYETRQFLSNDAPMQIARTSPVLDTGQQLEHNILPGECAYQHKTQIETASDSGSHSATLSRHTFRNTQQLIGQP